MGLEPTTLVHYQKLTTWGSIFVLSVVVEKFPDVVYAVVEVLHDVCREENGTQVE